MPTVTGRPNLTPTPTTTGATGATSASGVTGAGVVQGTTDPTATPTAQGPAPAAGLEGKPVPVVINGFGGKPLPTVNITLTPQPGQAGFGEARAELEEGGWVQRGFIDVRYQPALGGVDIEVESRHVRPSDPASYAGDDMLLTLQARVRDGGAERIVTLAVMFDGVMNPDKTSTALRRFHVDYDEVNRWLKAKNPRLELVPGDPLAVYAIWKSAGHQWGGFCREGSFETPAPLGRTTAIGARTGPVVAPTETVSIHDVIKPIDITLKLPDAMVQQYPLVLDDGAKFVSRREHETKFCPKSLDELADVTRGLLDLAAADSRAAEQRLLQMFGADPELSKARGYPVSGWKLHTTDRYYAKDAQGRILKDAAGLPIVAPMFDVYQDRSQQKNSSGDDRFPFARNNMAVRFRDGEIHAGATLGTMGKLNMKTPRVTDPFTAIQTGLELSLDTRPGISKSGDAMKQLADLLDHAPAPYNPLREQKKVAYDLAGSDVLASAVDNLANRYKFTLEHDNGMELEVSLDFVHAGLMFEAKTVEATKAMSEAEKFDHYAALLTAPDATVLCVSGPQKTRAGELNTVVIGTAQPNGTLDLALASFWTDAQGAKHCSEHPAVRFPQVEIEMDHVQARSTGPVQAAYANPSETKNLENDADQDKFLQGVQDGASMGGPPTTHLWEDLGDVKLYQEHNYVQLSAAVTSFREAMFPQGVLPARQKAAQALELSGKVPAALPALSASLPWIDGRTVSVSTDYQTRHRLTVRTGSGYGSSSGPAGGTVAKPCTLSLDWDGFPIKIPLTGQESTKDVATLIQQRLDQALFFTAVLSEKNGEFTIELQRR
ncbi:MAG: hypothetical protein HYS27_06065 [Deltaproteobacteria bacterium]|nr:hypothetical protein [Deltaproteobacteria bacterium]